MMAEEMERVQKELERSKVEEAKSIIERKKFLSRKVAELRKEGRTIREIASELQVSNDTVSRLLKSQIP